MRGMAKAICVSMLLVSCASLERKAALIKTDMPKNEVLKVLGEPGQKSFRGNREAWQYCQTGPLADHYMTVWFRDGKAEGITNENSGGSIFSIFGTIFSFGLCSTDFPAADWG